MSAALHYPSETALKAATLTKRGLGVFPCLPTKAPACPNGFKDAAKTERDTLDLWHRHYGPLIGVATGDASGICVLDLDLQHDPAHEWYDAHCVQLHGHRMHRTKSGGIHVVFRHREGIRNRARIGGVLGLDVRGEGGYVIWWPAAGLELIANVPPQPMPAWLVETIMPPPPPKADLAKIEDGLRNADRYVQGALRGAIRNVATAPEGARNDTLNAETYALGRFIPPGHLTASQIAEAMAAAALQAGLTQHEIERTIASALRARSMNG
ncbi:bifunctional DNA primase/polymerase [Brytella acorum]|uniref:Bifunctional DNA primase/polymerase n=1 Tax=Brytella acorum TaxID=2959299 RepID=A0AA35UPE7_9PROT|nr:bifunctional DNA primase/polymerase [Brytella acorum]MDF3625773.1 bifunctional DNA primase/polymerase [Brytella acorum]CAI9121211.1 bifunctional DNA primase/polymerase [Brytella acorum]